MNAAGRDRGLSDRDEAEPEAEDIDDVFDEDESIGPGDSAEDGPPPPASLAGIRIRANHPRTLRVTRRKHGDVSARTGVPTGPVLPGINAPPTDPVAPQRPRRAAEDEQRPLPPTVPRPLVEEAPPVRRDDPVDRIPPGAEELKSLRQQVRRRNLDPGRRATADLRGYWNRLRFGRNCPAWSDMDRDQVAFFWPNSVLLTCASAAVGQRRGPGIRSATRISDMQGRVQQEADIVFTEAMIAWILAIGRAVAESAEPLEETDAFPANNRVEEYQVRALPLIDDGASHVTHVLCQVTRL